MALSPIVEVQMGDDGKHIGIVIRDIETGTVLWRMVSDQGHEVLHVYAGDTDARPALLAMDGAYTMKGARVLFKDTGRISKAMAEPPKK